MLRHLLQNKNVVNISDSPNTDISYKDWMNVDSSRYREDSNGDYRPIPNESVWSKLDSNNLFWIDSTHFIHFHSGSGSSNLYAAVFSVGKYDVVSSTPITQISNTTLFIGTLQKKILQNPANSFEYIIFSGEGIHCLTISTSYSVTLTQIKTNSQISSYLNVVNQDTSYSIQDDMMFTDNVGNYLLFVNRPYDIDNTTFSLWSWDSPTKSLNLLSTTNSSGRATWSASTKYSRCTYLAKSDTDNRFNFVESFNNSSNGNISYFTARLEISGNTLSILTNNTTPVVTTIFSGAGSSQYFSSPISDIIIGSGDYGNLFYFSDTECGRIDTRGIDSFSGLEQSFRQINRLDFVEKNDTKFSIAISNICGRIATDITLNDASPQDSLAMRNDRKAIVYSSPISSGTGTVYGYINVENL